MGMGVNRILTLTNLVTRVSLRKRKFNYEEEARKYEEEGNYNMAIYQYEYALKQKKRPSLLYKLSRLYSKIKDFNKSLKCIEELIKLSFKFSSVDGYARFDSNIVSEVSSLF